MIVLGIETSGRRGSLALCEGEQALASFTFPKGKRRARDIVPAVHSIMQEAGMVRSDVLGVAVSEGPGSFTGLRIGVACAKTLAYALGWRCVGIPTLEVKAGNVELEERGDLRFTCPVQDARRGRVYGSVFEWQDGWKDTTGVLCLEPEALADAIPPGALVFGSGILAYPEVFQAGARFRMGKPELAVGRAKVVARLGAERFHAGTDVDPMELVPRYHRPTAPEEKLATGGE